MPDLLLFTISELVVDGVEGGLAVCEPARAGEEEMIEIVEVVGVAERTGGWRGVPAKSLEEVNKEIETLTACLL